MVAVAICCNMTCDKTCCSKKDILHHSQVDLMKVLKMSKSCLCSQVNMRVPHPITNILLHLVEFAIDRNTVLGAADVITCC